MGGSRRDRRVGTLTDRPEVLVTGANRGSERNCRQLAARGHDVILPARSSDAAEQVAAEFGTDWLQLDVADPESIAAAAAVVTQLDVLVNNAAIHYDDWQRAVDADLGVVREAIETDLYGAWAMVQAFLPVLRQSRRPRSVNVSSEVASLATMGSGTPAYNVSKVGLNALTKMLADELYHERFLVNAVCPGWVATDMGGPGGRPVVDGAAGVVVGGHPSGRRTNRRLLPGRTPHPLVRRRCQHRLGPSPSIVLGRTNSSHDDLAPHFAPPGRNNSSRDELRPSASRRAARQPTWRVRPSQYGAGDPS